MPIVTADLVWYGAASRPSDDTAASGGAIDLLDRPEFTQFSAAARPEILSDGADTRSVTIQGRNAAGAIISETNACTGTTPVLFAATYERILTITTTTNATRTISVRQGAGGSVVATITPNETSRTAMFRQSASEASSVPRYEKMFGRNSHATLTLNAASVKLTADPDARVKIGLAAAINGSTSVANRKAVPAAVSFVDDNVAQAVPGGVLAALDAIGTWIEQTLPGSDATHKTTFTVELSGTTT
jgi:hypothetical protein